MHLTNLVTSLTLFLVFNLTWLVWNTSADTKCEISNLTPRVVSVSNPTHQFLDSCGRSRWFRGTNVVKKAHPWHPDVGGPDTCNKNMDYPFCDEDMDFLQEMGVNVVRLGVMWAGAEPVRGEYNETYFEVIHGIIQRLADRGIYTLVDVHQDVMGRQLCGEGFPDWFIKKDWVQNPGLRFPFPQLLVPFNTDENGIPDPYSQCSKIKDWFVSYLTVASGNAYGRLYNNYEGLMDSFTDYWKKIATEYKDYNSVLGYDLLNEPWAGDIYANPALLVPGVADKQNLEYLWQNCSEKIRQVDSETLIFFEGVTWDIRDGHNNVPGYDGTKTAMSYHYYAPPQFTLKATYLNRLADMDRLQTGGMLTEFRMWAGDDRVMQEMRDTVDLADKYLQSWMGWEYSSVRWRNDDIEKHYARTYAPAVAGFVVSMDFNEDTSDFLITWTANTSITAPTEIKINKRLYYPHGFDLSISPENAATWEVKSDDQNILVRYTPSAPNEQNITVKIVKRPEPESQIGGVGNLHTSNPDSNTHCAIFLLNTLFAVFSMS